MTTTVFDAVAVARRLTTIDASRAPMRDLDWGLSAIDRLVCWLTALRADYFNAAQQPRPDDVGPSSGDASGGDAAADSDGALAGDDAAPRPDASGSDGASGENPELDNQPPLPGRDRLLAERRAEILLVAKLFAEALNAGRIVPAHVDVLWSVLHEVTPSIRMSVLERQPDLLVLAQRLPPPAFANALRRAVDRASAAAGLSQAARLLASTRLKQWDGDDGLHHVHVTFDPEHAGLFNAAMQAEIEALFHSGEHSELDHEQRAARALVNLVTSGQGSPRRSDPSRAEFMILADVDSLFDGLHDASVLETASARSIHLETARRLWCDAESVTWVLTIRGKVVSLITEDELANRKQRRAMRSMHRGCVFPGCGVGFDRCHLHHVRFRRHGGRTVIGNMLPLCYRHHHLVHEGGWSLTMSADRTVDWRRADGSLFRRMPHTPIGTDDQLAGFVGSPRPPGTAPPGAAPPGGPPVADAPAVPGHQHQEALFDDPSAA